MRGVAGVCIEEQPRRADHILSLVDARKINLKSPLRYYGRFTVVLQIGMLPLLANEFHRVTFASTFVNFAAVPLTAIIVPLGFCTPITGFLWPALGKILAPALSLVTTGLLQVVQRFALVQQLSYRIPGPPLWVTIIFLITLVGIV